MQRKTRRPSWISLRTKVLIEAKWSSLLHFPIFTLPTKFKKVCPKGALWFFDTRRLFNISALAGILLKSANVYLFFFSTIFRTIWIIQIFCSAVSVSERAAEDNAILVRWNERVVIIHSYADVIEMKRANVRNCAFVAPSYWDEANEC